jgi:hypothetical protein
VNSWDRAARLAACYLRYDLVIVTKSKKEMKEMRKNLGKYMRKKMLEVNVKKTKMEEEWREWVELERKENRTSKRFKYLGYTFNERAIREIARKANKEVFGEWERESGEMILGGEWWCFRAW